IVTGGARGIGATYASVLAANGATVVACDVLPPDETVETIRKAGGEALGAVCDVTDSDAVEAFVRNIESNHGRIDILVNNAAIFANLALKPFIEIDDAEWDRVMAVNVRGSFACAKAVVPTMRRQSYGKIINIASGTVFKGAPLMLHYVASKGAIVAMTRSLARELGDAGVRVNCLAPGVTMSEGVVANNAWAGPIVANNIASRCLKREATPDDLTGALIFLASPESDFITGQTIVVDGGSVTH
ncbi:MAG: SDR family oxidoreductase, partial [Rhizobiales bacterium]|nr:SDR family oxidoreductase [Hyphomicrobiales bacterium]